jgi:hypothetical protein
MKNSKTMVFLAAAAVMAAALGGASPASADTACKANESNCAAANRLTKLEGSTPSAEKASLTAGSFHVTCSSSLKVSGLSSLGANLGARGR